MLPRWASLIAVILAALVTSGCESPSSARVGVVPSPSAGAAQPPAADGNDADEETQPDQAPPARVTAAPPAPPGEVRLPATEGTDGARETQPEEPPPSSTRDGALGVETPDKGQVPEVPIPRYIKVLERVDAGQRAVVRARLEPPAKLELQTVNVCRLRITRSGLPLTTGRSTVLRLDDQVFEWLQRSDEVEFERSRNGIWSPIKRRKSGR